MKVVIVIGLPLLLMILGTVGYHQVEGWTWEESFYMTVITISTVGYSELHDMTEAGRMFSVLLILVSFGSLAYCGSLIFGFILEGGIVTFMRKMKMEQQINQLQKHFIVCGFGRKGKAVCRHFAIHSMPFVVIEKNHDHLETARDLGYLVLSGDAGEDAILEKACIQKAVGLIAILGVDAENVFLILSARQMNPQIQIVAWATVHEAEKKLYRAGADRVLSPFELGGFQVVQSMIRPNVMDFLNRALDIENEELQLDQILVQDDSPISGKALKDCDFRNSLKVLGIIRDGKHHYHVSGNDVFQTGDILIVMGEPQDLKVFHNRLD